MYKIMNHFLLLSKTVQFKVSDPVPVVKYSFMQARLSVEFSETCNSLDILQIVIVIRVSWAPHICDLRNFLI